MNENPGEPSAPLDYKKHQIVLASHQQVDNTWVCQYRISEGEAPQVAPTLGYVDGSYPSREAAELAAVQKAKALIDLY